MNKYDYLRLKIINFFGIPAQYLKLREEFHEVTEAYLKYKSHRSKKHLLALIEELNDTLNVAEGILLKEYGITEEEPRAEKHRKLNRTVDIIDKCDTPEQYDLIRNSDLK